jgi:4-hydroxybenzoate polyprenyltransferase
MPKERRPHCTGIWEQTITIGGIAFKSLWVWLRRRVAGLWRVARAGQWWDYKLVPIFSIFYATALTQQVSVASIWPDAIVLLLAIAPGAAYVSIINDITDRSDDLRAGKSNRLAGRPAWLLALLVMAPVSVGVVFTVVWRDDALLMSAYLCAWAAFSLYSLPPFRLKSKGILGVIADACGAHLFPTLVAALLALRATGREADYIWLVAVGAWAFACGLRGILWHQLYDLENDRKIGVQTFVVRHSARTAVRLARYAAFPLELVALAVLIWRTQNLLLALFLVLYALMVWLKIWLWRVDVVIVEPSERYTILGREYYGFLFPLAVLVTSALLHPTDWLVLMAHSLLFPGPAISFMSDIWWLSHNLIAHLRRTWAAR